MSTRPPPARHLALGFESPRAFCGFVDRAAAETSFVVPVQEPMETGDALEVRIRVGDGPELVLTGAVLPARPEDPPGVRVTLDTGLPGWREAVALRRRLGGAAAAAEVPPAPGSTQMYGGAAAAPEVPPAPGSTQMYGGAAAAPEAPPAPGSTQMYGGAAAAPGAAHPRLSPGDLLDGRYRIEAHLASGGMGDVYRATQVYMDRTVALKLLPRRFASDPDMAARFQREARIVSQLEHPQVVRVFDFGCTAGGLLYLAMEFVEGRPLHEVLQSEGLFAPERAVRFMVGVCAALSEAHAVGIVHRDLKPANVMVVRRRDGSEDVKVLDFGIARLDDAHASGDGMTQAGFVLGTPEYISPEQALAAPVDGRSDQYAAGVMAFELLTGRRPFVAEAVTRLVSQHVTAAPPHPARLRPELAALPGVNVAVLRALSKEQAERFPDMRAFAAALEAGLAAGAQADEGHASDPATAQPRDQATAQLRDQATGQQREPAAATVACPRCNRLAPEGVAFCAGCGGSLVVRPCPSCGAVAAPGAGFCQGCGQSLDGPAAHASPSEPTDRGADRPGYPGVEAGLRALGTAIAVDHARDLLAARRRSGGAPRAMLHASFIGHERLQDLLGDGDRADGLDRRLRTALLGLAHAHGGALDALDPEGATFLFDGGPDAGERAVRAALTIRGLVDLIRLGLGPEAPPLVAVAVAGGHVDTPGDGSPCGGEAPERARVLVSLGEDAVPVGRELAPDCGDRLRLERAERSDVLVAREAPLVALRRAPSLIGREPELERIEALLARGGGTSLVLVGEAGLGTSRLVEEAVARGRRGGWAVAQARGGGPTAAFGFLRTLLCRLAGIEPAERLDRLRPALEGLDLEPAVLGAALVTGGLVTVPPGFTGGEAAFAVTGVAAALAASRPLLLALDDLDQADDPSLQALAQLCALPPARTSLLLAGRPALLERLRARAEVVRLGPLVQDALTTLAGEVLGGRPVPERLAEALAAHAGGSPGRGLAFLDFVTGSGHLSLAGPAPVLRGVPAGLDDRLLSLVRVAGLPEGARRLLAAAALLEAPFAPEIALAAVPDVDGVLAWKQLERAGLIAPAGSGRLEPADPAMVRLVLGWYAGPGRAAAHRKLAEALRERLIGLDATPPAHAIATHFAAGGVHVEAVSWWRRAAESALRRRAHREAALALEALAEAWGAAVAAGAVAESNGASEQMQALTRAAMQALSAGADPLAERWLAAAAGVSGASPAADVERRIAEARLRTRAGRGDDAEALLEGLTGEQLSSPLQALRGLAWAEHFEQAGRPAAALEAFGSALAQAAAAAPLAAWHGEVDLPARIESHQAKLHATLGNQGEAQAAFLRAHARWTRVGHPLSEARLCATLGTLFARQSQPAEAGAWYERAADAADRAGDLRRAIGQRVNVAKAHRAAGQPADGRAFASRAADLAERIGWAQGARSAHDLERALAGGGPR